MSRFFSTLQAVFARQATEPTPKWHEAPHAKVAEPTFASTASSDVKPDVDVVQASPPSPPVHKPPPIDPSPAQKRLTDLNSEDLRGERIVLDQQMRRLTEELKDNQGDQACLLAAYELEAHEVGRQKLALDYEFVLYKERKLVAQHGDLIERSRWIYNLELQVNKERWESTTDVSQLSALLSESLSREEELRAEIKESLNEIQVADNKVSTKRDFALQATMQKMEAQIVLQREAKVIAQQEQLSEVATDVEAVRLAEKARMAMKGGAL